MDNLLTTTFINPASLLIPMGKRIPFAMIAVLLVTTILCFGALLFALTFMSETDSTADTVVEQPSKNNAPRGYSFAYPAPVTGTQTFVFGISEEEATNDDDDSSLSSSDEQLLENAQDAIDEIDEALDDIGAELDDVDDDIDDADDESDIDDVFDDLDDLEDDVQYQVSKISRWYNLLYDVEGSEADSLQEELEFLEEQADDLQDDINEAENDAEDQEDDIEDEEESEEESA